MAWVIWPAPTEGVLWGGGANRRAQKNPLGRAFFGNGGSGEIRTHGGVTLAGFQDQCLKPLGHTSADCRLKEEDSQESFQLPTGPL